jgi:hypothetical protein
VLLHELAQRLQNIGRNDHLIGMGFDTGKGTVEVKEKAQFPVNAGGT